MIKTIPQSVIREIKRHWQEDIVGASTISLLREHPITNSRCALCNHIDSLDLYCANCPLCDTDEEHCTKSVNDTANQLVDIRDGVIDRLSGNDLEDIFDEELEDEFEEFYTLAKIAYKDICKKLRKYESKKSTSH